MKPLYLHAGREKRILRGHRWIFSNEISNPLSDFEPGSWVEVFSSKNFSLGVGYFNPNSLISVRLVCPPGQEPTREFIGDLIRKAVLRRQACYPDSKCYRAVYAESDGLPGLVVDRYGAVIVYQITTLGMAGMEPLIRDLLREIFSPSALVFRNDASIRQLEGLPLERGIVFGEVPDLYWVSLDGIEYGVNFLKGQKTGLYLDQRDNRRALKRWVQGKRVLDLFCYEGAWGMTAASAGAKEVVGVDQSPTAIERARLNASRNGLSDRCSFQQGDVLSFLKGIPRGRFDVVILDPPAFTKSKNSIPEALKGYTDQNRRGLLALDSGGIFATSSCSYHINVGLFQEMLLNAAYASGKQLRMLEARGQALDHPVLLAMPETHYLKCCIMQVV